MRYVLFCTQNETFFKHCESSKQFGFDDKCVELWLHKHVLYNLRNHFLFFFRSDLHEWLELYLATTSFLPSFPPSYYYSGKASYSRIKIYRVNYVFSYYSTSLPKMLETSDPSEEEIEKLRETIVYFYDPWMFTIFFSPFISNPFIYVLSNQSYRKAYKDFFYKNVVRKFDDIR